ncbi:uncharacterized protein B0H18DRAFT_882195, partial [Fomitopsis serialis]|uniref:uncharacterized protein n=1 Tax=Fomitopsis serialis TaxID=139415 RepID=UPI0020085F63
LLGSCLNIALLGVLTYQTYMYHIHYPDDKASSPPLSVYGTFIFEWVQSGLLTASLFHIFVANYGDLNALGDIGYTWFSIPVMSAITSFVVQLFYSWRIQRFSGSYILPSIIVVVCHLFEFY